MAAKDDLVAVLSGTTPAQQQPVPLASMPPLDASMSSGLPMGVDSTAPQDAANWWKNGGIAGMLGMKSAAQQIAENEQAYRDLPADASLMDKMRVISDSPIMGALGVDAPIRAYHGSPHSFDAFDPAKIGTGEGAQAYGHGLYFAGNEGVARSYRDALSYDQPHQFAALTPEESAIIPRWVSDHILEKGPSEIPGMIDYLSESLGRRPFVPEINAALGKLQASGNLDAKAGHMYEVALHTDPASLLDWDKPLSAQSPQAQSALGDLGFMPNPPGQAAGLVPRSGPIVPPEPTGGQVYRRLAGGDFGGKAISAADQLRQAGIPGIQYLDAGSRSAGDGTRNYVMFDPQRIEILRKYGLLPPLASMGLLGGNGSEEPQ